MNEIVYLVSFKFIDKFGDMNYGHCEVVFERGNYAEDELIDFFVKSIRTNFKIEKEQSIVITNIINLTKIRKELEE